MRYILKQFWWFVLFAVLSVGGSIWAVASGCEVQWLYRLCAQYLRFAATVVGIGLATHFVGEALPRRWFRHDRPPFAPWGWERKGRVYEEAFHISRWKDAMPDKSQAVKSSVTKSVGSDATAAHLEALLAETCVSEAVHWGLVVISPVMFWTMELPLSVPGFLIYSLSNLPLIAIQRYNRPRLAALLALERRRQRRKAGKATDENGHSDL